MTDAFILTGTREVEPRPVMLAAGSLTAELVGGNLRSVRHDGTEVLRAIGYMVRDRDWGTYAPELSDLSHESAANGFEVNYSAACDGPGGARLELRARVAAVAAEGTLEFDVTATPHGDFETARCGFCVLHPIVELAGAQVSVEHLDGTIVDTVLPDLIEPWQPFKNMRAITHSVRPGVQAECRMEGDTFEMEDQRNWSDASYKTYVRPLELPWPYVLKSGVTFRQTVTLKITDAGLSRSTATGSPDERIRLELDAPGPKLPQIGAVIYPDDASATLANLESLKRLGAQRLLFHFDPTAGHGVGALQAFADLAAAYPAPATLECVVPCRRDLDVEFAEIAGQVRDARLQLAEIAVSPAVDRQSTPPGSRWPDCPPLDDVYAAARRTFPHLRLGGGMFSYFTELNRKRVPADALDFVTHCTCPIVHAADDLGVMQSLEALPFITRSVRAIYGDKPYRIGPSTIAMRQNPYGGATKDNPRGNRIAMANRDPRHEALFAAAWSVGYAARVAPAGLEQLILSAMAGPFGVLAQDSEAATGKPAPLFHVIQALAAISGWVGVQVKSNADGRVAALAARSPEGRLVMLIGNLTAGELTVDVSGLPRGSDSRLSVLDAKSIAQATGFRATTMADSIRLGAYAVARID